MDVVQQFCLRWNNYQSTLHHVFHKLWVNKVFVDVSLVVEGKRIDCHKVILSACSTYFEKLLSEHSSHPHPLILLHDIPFHAVEALVAFMYKGEINVNQDQLTAILKVAESLKIKGLADSAAISNFSKYRLLSPDITKITTTPYTQPLPSTSAPVSYVATSSEATTARSYSLPTVKQSTPVLNTIKKSDFVNGIMYPQKKRQRLEEPVESLPPSPPISLGELHNHELSRTSLLAIETTQEIKREQDDESDLELQIDETAPQSPSEPASSETMSNRNTPVFDVESQELAEKHETAQSLAALACQGAINLASHVPPQIPLVPNSLPIKIKEERVTSSGKTGGKNFDRPYTLQDLEDGIESVLKGNLTPAKAIAKYKVPRRTFFRRLSAVRKSRGIPSSKENSSDLVNSASMKIQSTDPRQMQPIMPGLVSSNMSYQSALSKASKYQVDNVMKENKAQGLNMNTGNVFSLLNVAANPNYEYYIKYLKLAQNKDISDDIKESKVDGNRNLTPDVSDQTLGLLHQNGHLL